MAAEAGDDAEEIELEEVAVTGTRIQSPGYSAPNPITTINRDEMDRLGIVNVADALTTLLPQNISDIQPTNSGVGSWFAGQTVANLRGLNANNGLYTTGSRTLTMIDGRRVVSSSNQADVVDMNMIPSSMLQRLDVVTGGASAAYGSGAMAGVVNLVLNNRLEGINFDMDYGVHEHGDGGNKHVSLAGGKKLFDGRAHILASAEWQKQEGINDCAAARDWCNESRGLFVNSANPNLAPGSLFEPLLPNMPLRFEADNLRRSQWSENSAISLDDFAATSGYKFNDAGTDIVPYTTGFRGGGTRPFAFSGFGSGNTVPDGDGPLGTYQNRLMTANDRKTLFSHFEFDFNERITGYAEGNYSDSSGANPQYGTVEDVCVRFHTPGVAAQAGQVYPAGTGVYIFGTPPAGSITAGQAGGIDGFSAWLNTPGNATFQFAPFFGWVLNLPFTAPTIAAVPPGRGADENAYLSTLTPAALAELQRVASTPANANANVAGNLPTAGSAQQGNAVFRGTTPCRGMAGLTKVWDSQMSQITTRTSETVRGVIGVKGRFGTDWRYDAYYQYGATDSSNVQQDSRTSYRLAFALDSVIDNRELIDGQPNPTFNQPVCRYVRDGLPTNAFGTAPGNGDELSDPAGVASLLEGCVPLNPFGQAASAESLAYAFRPITSAGKNTLDVLSVTTSGTLWNGWAGPLTGAFGAEFRKDTVDNVGTEGNAIERIDFQYNWGDSFGGTTKVMEEYAELNLPLVSNVPGANLWSINGAIRHGKYKNQGGAGTTGESGTQSTTNWKVSTIFEPFDWVRLRLTRSRDLRAATYRELYNNASSVPDNATGTNYWRDYDPLSTTNRTDRLTSITGGNPNLKPEKSDTLTIGLVLSPGGWAQGMRLTADYYDIRVKDGLTGSFTNPIQACWEGSGNRDPVATSDPPVTEVNGLFDPDNEFCKRIVFGVPDPGDPLNPYSNITAYRTSYENAEPFQTRGVDFSWSYVFAANQVFEQMPGNFSLSVRGTRALEASGLVAGFLRLFVADPTAPVDIVGQLSSGLGFVPGIQPTPKWAGNIVTSYMTGPATVSLSARYVGGAKIDKTFYSDGPGQPYWQDENGQFVVGSIADNSVPNYLNFSLNGSYDLQVSGVKQFQLFGTINNLFDKDPLFSGGPQSGANPQFHDVLGRGYKLGVRMRF
jgi:outer membrane receptor protein involved in Fe transport